MVKNTHERVVLKLWVVLTLVSVAYGIMGGASCSSLKKVEIHHKTYFDLYLTVRYRTHTGIFYDIINEGVKRCCPTAAIEFSPILEDAKSIEEILVDTVKHDRVASQGDVVKLFLPEFADKVALDVYDASTPFLRLTRSPGHAVVMVKPPPKEPVFVGEIVVKSWAILIFLVTFAWMIGILAWASDHHVNPKEFPNPFYVGMFEGFWWSIVTMTTVGYGDKAPKGILARLLAVLWIMISTVFLALFTANATAILAASQAEEDYSITLGKRIGVLNSKHFVEVELNLGATIIEYGSTLEWAVAASQDSDADRLMFPNYLDFLLFVKNDNYKGLFQDAFVLTNAIKHPFQIGMALAAENDNLTLIEEEFLKCMRFELPTLERQVRSALDYSQIEFAEDTKTKKLKMALDSDNLLMMSYYFFGMIAFLASIGLCWDLWVYRQRIRANAAEVEDSDEQSEFDDVVHGSQSSDMTPPRPGPSSPTMREAMSLPMCYDVPPAPDM